MWKGRGGLFVKSAMRNRNKKNREVQVGQFQFIEELVPQKWKLEIAKPEKAKAELTKVDIVKVDLASIKL